MRVLVSAAAVQVAVSPQGALEQLREDRSAQTQDLAQLLAKPAADPSWMLPSARVFDPRRAPSATVDPSTPQSATVAKLTAQGQAALSARGGQAEAALSAQQAAGGAAPSRALLWVHIHKAGGTTMCSLAQQNERVVQPNDNCNLNLRDSWRDSGHRERALSCERRAAVFAKGNYSWGAIERELWPEDWCPESFDYGTMLRAPLSLMQSNLNFFNEYWHIDESPESIVARLREDVKTQRAYHHHDPQNPDTLASIMPVYDNFMVRQLAGAGDVPMGQVNQSHLSAALEVLGKFAVVATVERFDDDAPQVFQALGWPADTLLTHANSNHDVRYALSDEPRQYLEELNVHDTQLYRQAAQAPRLSARQMR